MHDGLIYMAFVHLDVCQLTKNQMEINSYQLCQCYAKIPRPKILINIHDTGRWAHINIKLLHFIIKLCITLGRT